MLATTLLQITTAQSELNLSTTEPATDSLTLIDLIMKGGIIMLPIFLLSFIALYVIIERVLVIKKATKNYELLMGQVKAGILSGDIKTAQMAVNQYPSVIARMVSKGIQKIGTPIKQIEAAMEGAGKVEVMKLEKGLGLLGIVASIAPMMGFIGTISGVIKIFYNISLQDNISIGLIAGGLYEKMVTSAAGLVVGIIAHVGYHYINIMIENVVLKMEISALDLIETISDEK